ncbi:MAG: hypothetical protein KUG68_07800 [Flavobacteriaceae bacterium]|nr:hypothetical protein [Flavobacteriaceae bacterium]
MKKTILLAVITIFTFSNLFAQEATESNGLQGAWWGMGTFQYSDDETTSSYTILPIVGNFIAPTVTVGLGAGYMSTETDGFDSVGTFVVMPLVRKYWSVSDKLYLFGQADVPLTFSDDTNGYGFNVRPGIDYFIGGKFTIEATFGQFGYNSVKNDITDESTGTTSLGFDMTSIQFGLKYLF